MAQDSNEATQQPASKRKVDRSAAYPVLTIEDSLVLVADVYKNFRNEYAKRNDILNLIEGVHPRHIAAASHYGLLDREKDSYRVSELYKNIANPIDQTERKSNLRLALYKPSLYKELIDKFEGDVIPETLVYHLSRFHRITEDAAPLAADVFIKNLRYCGVINENGVLRYKDGNYQDDSTKVIIPNSSLPNEVSGLAADVKRAEPIAEQTQQKLLPEIINEEKSKIRLTGGRFAYLIYPFDLNKKDIIILQKEIEQLELLVE